MGSTVIPPALSPTNLASKPRPLVNRTATRFPFHSLGKYPANVPPLSAYILLRASYPCLGVARPSWDRQAPSSSLQAGIAWSIRYCMGYPGRGACEGLQATVYAPSGCYLPCGLNPPPVARAFG